MLRDIVIGLIVLLALSVIFIWSKVARLVRRDGASLAYANPEKPLWKRCEPCDGCGVISLGGDSIPLEYRSYYRSLSNTAKQYGVIQGPIANTERCDFCQGLGSTWHYSDVVRPIDLPGPGFGGKWN